MRRFAIDFIVILTFCLAGTWCKVSDAQSGTGQSKSIWAGSSGGYYTQWTGSDISIRAKQTASKPLYSARVLLTGDLEADEVREAEFDLKLLSVVGPLVSYEVHAYIDGGGAHPQLVTFYQVADAAHPARKAILTDFFPDSQVLKALLADKIIHKVLAEDSAQPAPKNCAELVKRLDGKEFGGEGGLEYGFGPDLLSGFAFHHIEGDKVAVRLSVSHGTEIYRGEHTQIGILLPIPSLLQHPLKLATSHQEGFLMQDALKLYKDKQAIVKFSPKRRK